MKDSIKHFGFNPENYKLLFIGLAVNILGYILMIGGGAESLNEFNADVTINISLLPINSRVIVDSFEAVTIPAQS